MNVAPKAPSNLNLIDYDTCETNMKLPPPTAAPGKTMDEITPLAGKTLSSLVDRKSDLISIGDLASLLSAHTDENQLVWFGRLRAAGNAGELHVRHFPDGRIVGTEGSLRDQAGGRHFMARDVAAWLAERYPPTWENLLVVRSRPPAGPDMTNPQSLVLKTGQDGPAAVNSCTSQNRIGRSKDALWPLILEAKEKASDPTNISAIYAILMEMARSENPPAPLLGVTEDGIQYLKSNDEVGYLTKNALNKRLNPSARGKKKI